MGQPAELGAPRPTHLLVHLYSWTALSSQTAPDKLVSVTKL